MDAALRAPLALALLVVVAVGCGDHAAPSRHAELRVYELARYPLERRGYLGIGSSVRRVDPETLRPLTRRGLRLGGQSGLPVFSPDRKRAAFGLSFGELVLVDLDRMELTARIRLASAEWDVRPVGWPRPGLLVALGCLDAGKYGCIRNRLFLVDPTRHRRRASLDLEGPSVGAYDRESGRSVVLVTRPADGLRPARLVVVERDGLVREVDLDRIVVGIDRRPPLGPDYRSAGLALDRGRAIVAGPSGPVAEVSSRTLRVRYHRVADLDGRPARLGSARLWSGTLAPQALHERSLARAWPGVLAVTDAASILVRRGRGVFVRYAAPGIRLLDTRTWSTRELPRAEGGRRVGPLFVVSSPSGLVAYERSGAVRYRIPLRSFTWSAFGDRLYLGGIDGTKTRVLDGRTGRLLRRVGPTEVEPAFRWIAPG